MSTNVVVRARVNAHIKEKAAIVLKSMGLTVSDAFRILLTRIARDKTLPFEPLIPNKETIAAIREARQGVVSPNPRNFPPIKNQLITLSRQGRLKSFNSIEELMSDLADD